MIAVVACGNPLRGDAGVAWRVAERLERAGDPVVPLTLQHLTPELALVLCQADGVIFVTAGSRGTPGAVCVAELRAEGGGAAARRGHHLEPEAVLSLARGLFDARPRAALVTISGERFEHGEALSLAVRRAVPRALRAIRRLVRGWSLQALPEGTTLDPPRIPHA